MKKTLSIFMTAILIITMFIGCSNNKREDNNTSNNISNKKISIITTMYPQYDFAKQIVGDKADVKLLVLPGMEAHTYSPTPQDVININTSDLFIYTGKFMESWAERFIDGMDNKDVAILDVSQGITLSKLSHKHNQEKDESENTGHNHTFDPHIWTSPVNAKIMVDNILLQVCKIDSENKDYYTKNADEYKKQLDDLDKEFRDIVQKGNRKFIVHGGRNALHYFSQEYGIEIHSAYDSCSAETEPSAKVVAGLMDEIKQNNIPVIFYEELSSPKVAQSISDETGAKMLLFHSCHNVSKEDFENGVSYIDIMKQNAVNLREGLK